MFCEVQEERDQESQGFKSQAARTLPGEARRRAVAPVSADNKPAAEVQLVAVEVEAEAELELADRLEPVLVTGAINAQVLELVEAVRIGEQDIPHTPGRECELRRSAFHFPASVARTVPTPLLARLGEKHQEVSGCRFFQLAQRLCR